jgi:disulfide bond formation protein DsbB
MLYGLVLGVYHSGVEWHWWEGPASPAPHPPMR